ncbi:hypothetical protein [Desulfovibrio inopinatus]|uniref:hypothetical protein n=1 Tax=Desulfovibrio inopinatus TaxID=102109 RepID=UPI00041F68CA|nr:hypothetical protein [Desulfovibrio inopinatus]
MKKSFNISGAIGSTVLIALVLLVALFTLGIIPMYLSNQSATRTLEELRFERDKYKVMLPVYKRLTDVIHTFDQKYHIQQRSALSTQDISMISKTFIELAENTGMAVSIAAPDPRTLENQSKMLAVDLELLGELNDFREILLRLAALPYLVKFEKVRITQTSSGKKYFIKFWLALK